MEKPVTTALTKAIVISLILIILGLTSYFMDFDPQGGFQYIGYVVFIAGIIWSVMSYGKQVDYNATFGKYFVHGFSVTAIITVIMILFVVVFVLAFPEMKEKGMEKAAEKMHADKKLTEEEIQKGMDIARRFFMVGVIGVTLLFYIFFGAVSALIGAAITKKNPRPLFEDDIKPIE